MKKATGSSYYREELTNIIKAQLMLQKIKKIKVVYLHHYLSDMISRRVLLSEYYKIPDSLIDSLIGLKPDERKSLCAENRISPHIFRSLFDYSAYADCFQIYRFLNGKVEFSKISLLDFGCLVSDYGFFLGC